MAHMVADVSMPATLGYLMGLMYNPNNVSAEAGPITHVIEHDVGQQLCNMLGFHTQLGGSIPYTPEALTQRQENQKHYLERDPEVKCDLPGVPRANYMPFPFQIVQSAKTLLISYEYDGAVRDILFNDPGPAPIDSWMGQSVGKWDGDTLVVTVTGQNDSTWFDRAGNFHSGDMKVVERWTLMNENTIRYEAEITDPATFTRPWKMSMLMYRRLGEDARLQQFKCVEFVEELMYGDLRKEPLK